MILHLLLFCSILVIILSSSPAGADCNRVCKGSNHDIPVRYPFGFSHGCKIHLECADIGVRLAGYPVLNLTRDHILINLPAKCDRPFGEVHRFSTQSYAPTWRNGLLLGNCSQSLNDCAVSASIIQGRFNLPSCESTNNSLTCYSDYNRDSDEFINMTRLEKAGCRVLYSSITVDLNGNGTQSSTVSLGFQSVELGWWVQGDCHCHQKAVCKSVSIGNATLGYRCYCNEGYDGDGFVDGYGCRKGSFPASTMKAL